MSIKLGRQEEREQIRTVTEKMKHCLIFSREILYVTNVLCSNILCLKAVNEISITAQQLTFWPTLNSRVASGVWIGPISLNAFRRSPTGNLKTEVFSRSRVKSRIFMWQIQFAPQLDATRREWCVCRLFRLLQIYTLQTQFTPPDRNCRRFRLAVKSSILCYSWNWTFPTFFKEKNVWKIKKTLGKESKVAHTRWPSVGFWSWSRFLAVSLQVMWVINPAVKTLKNVKKTLVFASTVLLRRFDSYCVKNITD